MSSSVFTESSSARPAKDGDHNLVVVYGKNGISFDERSIENIMEEKSIGTISVVRLTSPTPSMLAEEEAERLEELERFLENATDRDDSDKESDDGVRSGLDEVKSEKDHVTGDDNDDHSVDNNDDSTETEQEVVKVRKRPGRKPKVVPKPKKRRKPKERPQIVGLSVEQLYTDSSADLVVKNALKMAGVSIFKRTPQSDALLEIIKNDHNYTPFTSPEQLRAQKNAEKLANERQAIHARKLVMPAPINARFLPATNKKRINTIPFSQMQNIVQRPQLKQTVEKAKVIVPAVSVLKVNHPIGSQRVIRGNAKIVTIPADVRIEDDEDANISADDDHPDAEKSVDMEDSEQYSELSDESRETDNDRDSDADFKMNNSRSSNKRKRVKKLGRRSHAQAARGAASGSKLLSQQFLHIKRRKRSPEHNDHNANSQQFVGSKALGLDTQSLLPMGRIQSTALLKMRPANKSQELKNLASPPSLGTAASKMRRTPIVQTGTPTSTSQNVKEIIINKKLTSPKGVFTNLNTLLGDTQKPVKNPAPVAKQRLIMTPNKPKPNVPLGTQSTLNSKGFMPIGVETAASYKLPAQIVIETHQSSSELAAENDKNLDLINSIVQDELLKPHVAEQPQKPPVIADENIPKIVKMLESTAADLVEPEPLIDVGMPETSVAPPQNENDNELDLGGNRLDKITADFLQHVVGLIEEDKQFEAEVVKQVLASTEPSNLDVTAGIDAIANAIEPIFDVNALPTLPALAPPQVDMTDMSRNVSSELTLPESAALDALPTVQVAASVPSPSVSHVGMPMACSTPSSIPSDEIETQSRRPDVKIVRGNRVICLPPIEAPTTRAKRRAQNTSRTDFSSSTSLQQETSTTWRQLLANDSVDSDTQPSPSAAKKLMPRDKLIGKRSVTPRRSRKLNTSLANDTEASESQEDDDDPNKLWCICRQPHNNRFMICCDQCEDWYHGTCVNVTKAMGLEMELKGMDWKCPKCVKIQEEKSQPRITDMLIHIRPVGDKDAEQHEQQLQNELSVKQGQGNILTKQVDETTKYIDQQQAGTKVLLGNEHQPSKRIFIKAKEMKPQPRTLQLSFQKQYSPISGITSATQESSTQCIVCKRLTRSNAVYCSDECIRKYAQMAIQTQTGKSLESVTVHSMPMSSKKKDLFEDMLLQADSMSKVERVTLLERRTGRIITGHNAPAVQNLKKFLQENPTFEVLQPSSVPQHESEKRQMKLPAETTQTVKVIIVQADSPTSHAVPLDRNRIAVQKLSGGSEMLTMKQRKERNQAHCLANAGSPTSIKPEPIRLNVRRTLKEHLLARIKELKELLAQDPKSTEQPMHWLTVAEVDQFAKSVESEMYHSFGRDVGAKYKSKYRSLMFNIKDRKNKTLFDKICAKQVDARQLVRMTPAELASQELAKWREEENRHQLDMIKKSELDLLACAKNYLVKTHKGEEIIEGKLDLSLPDVSQDVLESVDKGQDIITQNTTNDSLNTESQNTKLSSFEEKSISISKDKEKEKTRDRDKEKERERNKERERERDKRHRSHKHHYHHHHQSNAKRSRSRSKSRSDSIEKRHKSTPRRDDRHHNEYLEQGKSKEKEQQHDRDKLRVKERSDTKQEFKEEHKKSPLYGNKAAAEQKQSTDVQSKSSSNYNLIDQILESKKTVEEAANLTQITKPTHKTTPVSVAGTTTTPSPTTKGSSHTDHIDVYGRFILSQYVKAMWTGELTMMDVADFHVNIYPVQGNAHQLGMLLPSSMLNVIGRITRGNVWEYIKKIRKSPTKEIVIVNMMPTRAVDTPSFKHFFEYLDSRQRLGVLGTNTDQIRDFYIFPLGAQAEVPDALLDGKDVPFYENINRPDTLLGIIVRCISKRSLATAAPNLPALQLLPTTINTNSKTSKTSRKSRTAATYTPPGSPKRKHSIHSTSSKDDEFDIDAIIKAPIVAKTQKKPPTHLSAPKDDPNAPYSPGGSSDDNDDTPSSDTKEYLKRKVDEIDKQIAAQQKEIAGLLNVEPSVLDGPTSSPNVLNSISIPPNLSKILASIKEKPDLQNADDEYNPEDAILSYPIAHSGNGNGKKPTKAKSRLAQLSEAELLSMVPDNLVDVPPPSTSSFTRYKEPPPPGV